MKYLFLNDYFKDKKLKKTIKDSFGQKVKQGSIIMCISTREAKTPYSKLRVYILKGQYKDKIYVSSILGNIHFELCKDFIYYGTYNKKGKLLPYIKKHKKDFKSDIIYL